MNYAYKLPYRSLPKEGIFKKECIENPYNLSEYKDDFSYYENTEIDLIDIDEHHLLPWEFFLEVGINYLLPRVMINIQQNIYNISTNLKEFIQNMIYQDNIKKSFLYLNNNELIIFKDFLQWLLFDTDSNTLNDLGEHTLFNNIQYIENLINIK